MPAIGRFAFALSIACAIATASSVASAVPTELVAGLGIQSPTLSDYRGVANQLGYGLQYPRIAYEAELGARFAVLFDRKLWIAPLVRLNVNRMAAAYDGLDTIWAEGLFAALREEYRFADFPPLFVWVDEGFGVGRVGSAGAYAKVTAWQARCGVGLRLGWPEYALRARIGYAWAPTFQTIAGAGNYDFGGVIFTIDGVLRVVDG